MQATSSQVTPVGAPTASHFMIDVIEEEPGETILPALQKAASAASRDHLLVRRRRRDTRRAPCAPDIHQNDFAAIIGEADLPVWCGETQTRLRGRCLKRNEFPQAFNRKPIQRTFRCLTGPNASDRKDE